MRRTTQEISSREEIEKIIQRAQICRLAMCRNDVPYVVPLNFGYSQGRFYFHGAHEGLKLDEKVDSVTMIEVSVERMTGKRDGN